ncbi:MAG TPA: kelch repeat-containing protein [Holophagaceae bacterium]|nr:kelch repeat-containing protein [Holophagaceae bacterium]
MSLSAAIRALSERTFHGARCLGALLFLCALGMTPSLALAQSAPVITTQPASQEVKEGLTATFTAAASGSPAPTYQWQRYASGAWTDLSGATASTYTTAVTTAADNGAQFRVVATNASGTATSNAAVLTVDYFLIVGHAIGQTVNVGQTATFSGGISTNKPSVLSYQWYKSLGASRTPPFPRILGATSASYTTPPAQASDDGTIFYVVVSNGVIQKASYTWLLNISNTPIFTLQPAGQTVKEGQTATFTASAGGTTTPAYQWQRYGGGGAWNDISGATSATYTTAATAASDDGAQFRVQAAYGSNVATSSAATLTVYYFTIVSHASTIIEPPGATATFSGGVATNNPGLLSYQWYRQPSGGSWAAIPGATASSYTTPTLSPADNGSRYYASVTNGVLTKSTYSWLLTITNDTLPDTTITAESSVVESTTGHTATVADQQLDDTYTWSITNGSITAGQGTRSITYTAGSPGYVGLTCAITNSAGTGTGSARVAVLSTLNATLFAQDQVFPGSTAIKASVNAVAGETYAWTITNGTATATATSATNGSVLTYAVGSAAGAYQLSVDVQDASGHHVTLSRTLQVVSGSWIKGAGTPLQRRYHTATTLRDGRILVVGGDAGISSATSVPSSADLYDPATGTWASAGSMGVSRSYHTATLLGDGQVLVVGGSNNAGAVASAQLYDPATNTWSSAGSLATARYQHTATLLPDGRVLVAGGYGGTGYLASCELYDPALNGWSGTAPLSTARTRHAAVLLQDGSVMVAGGVSSSGGQAACERYFPATNVWSGAGAMSTARYDYTLTLLASGKLLAAGGASTANSSSELYDPVLDSWGGKVNLLAGHYGHSAALLGSGKVLVAGGGNGLAATELYDPAGNAWSSAGNLALGRNYLAAATLQDGSVLAVGGMGNSGGYAFPERYDPVANTWSSLGGVPYPRQLGASVLLGDGTLLFVGGSGPSGPRATVDRFDPSTGTWTSEAAMATARYRHTATLLPGGKVLVAGGYGAAGALTSAEVFDPGTHAWTAAGSLAVARYNHTAILLGNGKVLAAGGASSTSAELYDPGNNTWSGGGTMSSARSGHTATLLGNGKVLVAGGGINSSASATAELYDPGANGWSPATSMGSARSQHAASLLPSGKVLVTGGVNGSNTTLATAELYDPSGNSWSPAASMTTPRRAHSMVVLGSGKLLVLAGDVAASEQYDPGANSWSAAQPLAITRHGQSATLLNSGQVLVVGGIIGCIPEFWMP